MPGIGVGISPMLRRGGKSWSAYWTTRGVIPGADATLITEAINEALQNYSHVKITEAGIYDIDGTIYIPSNTTLEFVTGCTLRKATGSSFYHMIANENIQTLTADTNVTVIGNGLNVDVNGIDNVGGAAGSGLRGQLMFYQVTNLTVTGIETTTIETNQFFMHLAEVTNVILRNIDVEGNKDGIHFGVADNVLMEDIRTATKDDGIALNARDYAVSNPTVGDITNVTIRRWTDDVYAGQGGSGCLLLSGSWTDWTTATDYLINDLVVNAGNIYQKTSAGTQTSANAPIHTSGSATGADGIAWKWVQAGTINHADVTGVTFEDCVWKSRRSFVRTIGSAVDGTMRAFYPGTGAQSIVDNIVIDNLTVTPAATGLSVFLADVNIGSIEIKNTDTTIPDTDYLVRIVPRAETFTIDSITFNGCALDLEGDTVPIVMPAPTYAYAINTVSIINGSDIRTDDASRASLLGIPAKDIIGEITLEDSDFHHLKNIFFTTALDDVVITISATRCTFDETCERLIWLSATTNSTITFNAVGCGFEETSLAMFENENATSTIDVLSTGSTGESIPNLKKGDYVDVSESDLVLALGDNIVKNGKFRENVTGWTAVTGAIAWESDGSCKFTASTGASPAGIYQANVPNPLSNNITIKFKAKSPTLTDTMRIDYSSGSYEATTNPALSTDWQDYEFEGVRSSALAAVFFLTVHAPGAGAVVYFDEITIVQHE